MVESVRVANDYFDYTQRTFVGDKEGLKNWIKKHGATDFVKEPPKGFLGQNAIGHALIMDFPGNTAVWEQPRRPPGFLVIGLPAKHKLGEDRSSHGGLISHGFLPVLGQIA